jgi:hypothetical protein
MSVNHIYVPEVYTSGFVIYQQQSTCREDVFAKQYRKYIFLQIYQHIKLSITERI